MKFIVDVPDEAVWWARAEGVSRQQMAQFMREELQLISRRYGHIPGLRAQEPGYTEEWRGFLFNRVRVGIDRKSLALRDLDVVVGYR